MDSVLLTGEVQYGFSGDGCGDEGERVQLLESVSADLCCPLLVQLVHVIQLQHTQIHTVPHCTDTNTADY